MGDRGPIPNLDSDLARPRARKGGGAAPEATEGERLSVTIPEPYPEWDELSMMAYNSLLTSGQKEFFQDSDWAYAFILLDEFNAYRRPIPARRMNKETHKFEDVYDDDGNQVFYRKLSGQMFQTLMSALGALGMTEGDRRRMRIELKKRPTGPSATVTAIESARRQLAEAE